MAGTYLEVCWRHLRSQCSLELLLLLEQRKAALRKVEIELDEADDIVSFSPSLKCLIDQIECRCRNWRSKFKEFRSQ